MTYHRSHGKEAEESFKYTSSVHQDKPELISGMLQFF